MVSQDDIVDFVCKGLELNKDQVVPQIKSKKRTDQDKFGSARQMICYLIRKYVVVPYADIPKYKNLKKEKRTPTYKQIAKTLNTKSHESIIDWELNCKIRLRDDKEFQEKYNKALSLISEQINAENSQNIKR